MPYYESRPSTRKRYSTLVKTLARELRRAPQPLPGRISEAEGRKKAAPIVIQEVQRLTDRYFVYVIWNAWERVPESDRGSVILDAYEDARGEADAARVMAAMGVTHEEAKQLGII